MKIKLKIIIILMITGVVTYLYTKVLLFYFGILLNFSQDGTVLSGTYASLNLLLFFIGINEEDFKRSLAKVYLIQGIVMIPPITVYGIVRVEGIMFYLVASVLFLTLPLTPICLSNIVGFATKKKEFRILIKTLLSFMFSTGYVVIYNVSFTKEYFNMLFNKGGNALSLILPFVFPLSDSGALALTYTYRTAGKIGFIISILQGILFLSMYRILRRTSIKSSLKDEK